MTERTCTECQTVLTGRQTRYCCKRCAQVGTHRERVARGYLVEKRTREAAERDARRKNCTTCGTPLRDARVERPRCRSCRQQERNPRPLAPPVQTLLRFDPRSAVRSCFEDGDWRGFLEAVRRRSTLTDAGCWRWPKIKDGYPVLFWGSEQRAVHRMVLEAKHQAPLGSQAAHHICANTACVNPEHLQPVTHRENMAEMLARRSYVARIQELEKALSEIAPAHPILAVIPVSHTA